jgi:hypothetical protein
VPTLGHDCFADGDIGGGDQLGEDRVSGSVYRGRAVAGEGGLVGVDLGGPEDVRVVRGPVDGIEDGARLPLRPLEQRPGLARGAAR